MFAADILAVVNLLGRNNRSGLDGLEIWILRGSSMEYGPLVGLLIESLPIIDHHFSNFSILGIFRLGTFE